MRGAIVYIKNDFFGPKWCLDNYSAQKIMEWAELINQAQTKLKLSPTQFKKAQIHDNQPIKGFKDIYGNFQFVKVSAQMVRLCLKIKWNETFSPT